MLTDLRERTKKGMPCNFIVDNLIRTASLKSLEGIPDLTIKRTELSNDEFQTWVREFVPGWKKTFKFIHHKKLLEFFCTFQALGIRPEDAYMDAGGGTEGYLMGLRCEKKYLQDIRVGEAARKKFGNAVQYVECDAGSVPLPDQSLDKISCHHSFEHFQNQADTRFVREIQRLLRPGGRAAIVPIFIADRYVEITDTFTFELKFDPESHGICDPSCRLPGGDSCGNYARVYDRSAFRERVVNAVDVDGFRMTLSEVTLDGRTIPDPSLPCHRNITAINYPYRLLLLEHVV